ncbi:MAG: hypothetical protein CO093_04565 [Alphaproteobacteria bacterium CG_4_9_14_3_um_filter_47_13]|nr:MAG: hypothetical protein CO093_04565 [Alphaproteobacteria bacterium CG_4_9_14_3_um_filter_47_13]
MFYGIDSLTLSIAFFCGLLLLSAAVKHYTKKWFLPPEGWILLLGLGYGITGRHTDWQWQPELALEPHIVLTLFLPLLIFASGRMIRPDVLKSAAAPIGFFAILGVIATAFIIGWPVALLAGIPLVHGLVLGAATSAVDPAAVGSIFKSFEMPERLKTIIEGESLFNDGVTVVLFTLISALALGNTVFDPADTAFDFLWAVLAAIPLGLSAGWLAATLLCRWGEDQSFFTASISVILAYGTFLIAEDILHVSGVIAVLMAAIVFSKMWSVSGADEKTKEKARMMGAFWDYISQTLNAFLFFMLGAMSGAHDFSALPFTITIAAVAVLLLSRAAIAYGGGALLRFPISWQNVMMLGGLRGGISAALVLLIPHDYAHQQMFLCLAFIMIAFTLIVFPPLLSVYLKRADMSSSKA